MIIDIPTELVESFISFLDIHQGVITKEEYSKFIPTEQKTIDFIRGLIGKDYCKPCATVRERIESTHRLAAIVGK
jgi:hypothetical protein